MPHLSSRWLVGLCLILVLAAPTPGWSDDSEPLAAYETRLFSRTFEQEPTEDRLARLERAILGEAQKGAPEGRARHLESILNNTPSGEAATTSTPNTSQDSEEPGADAPRVKEATDYPAVTELERTVLKQAYPQEDIRNRLTRLEQQVFHQNYDELPMVDRVDQLTLKVFPNGALGVDEGSSAGLLPTNRQEFAPSNVAVYSQVTSLEEQALGRAYAGDVMTHRLSRLEQQVFGAPRSGSIDTRVSDLVSQVSRRQASRPQPSIGAPQAYTPNPSGQDTTSRINAMMGNHFSPELFQMLPGNIRQQLAPGGTPPPAMATPETPIYPGNTAWGQSPSQEQAAPYSPPASLYQPPGSFQRSPMGNGGNLYQQGRTPVMPAFPVTGMGQMVLPQQYNNAPNFFGPPVDTAENNGNFPMTDPNGNPIGQGMPNNAPMGMPMDAYSQQYQGQAQQGFAGQSMTFQQPTGQNPLMQNVTILESQVFGRTYAGGNLNLRLNNLEQNVFGTTSPQFSPQQRINRLMRKTTQQGFAPTNLPHGKVVRRLPRVQSPGKPSVGGILGQAMGSYMSTQMTNSGISNPVMSPPTGSQGFGGYSTSAPGW